MPTKIEWTDEAWNPFSGCTPISEGCDNCYAAKMAKRLRGRCGYPADDPFRPTFHPDKLKQPLHWKKPKKIFVCSMSDLFHAQHALSDIRQALLVMEYADKHIFQVLTKRPRAARAFYRTFRGNKNIFAWPKNIWFGITVENQSMFDDRLLHAFNVPAKVKFLSVEPMLGPINLSGANTYTTNIFKKPLREMVHWVICGGESGKGKNIRKMKLEWVLSLRDQCNGLGIPFFFKQWGEWFPQSMADDCQDSKKKHWMINDALWTHGAITNGMCRIGKKAAGRILEGRTWEEMPNGK